MAANNFSTPQHLVNLVDTYHTNAGKSHTFFGVLLPIHGWFMIVEDLREGGADF